MSFVFSNLFSAGQKINLVNVECFLNTSVTQFFSVYRQSLQVQARRDHMFSAALISGLKEESAGLKGGMNNKKTLYSVLKKQNKKKTEIQIRTWNQENKEHTVDEQTQ